MQERENNEAALHAPFEILGHGWPNLDQPEAAPLNLESSGPGCSDPGRIAKAKKSPEGQGEPSGPVESRSGEGPDFLGSTQGGE
jgi:hypothetical protein